MPIITTTRQIRRGGYVLGYEIALSGALVITK
jgi:hypothetical protein